MTKDAIKEALLAIVDSTTSAGSAETLTQEQLDEICYAVLDTVDTVRPNLPPRP